MIHMSYSEVQLATRLYDWKDSLSNLVSLSGEVITTDLNRSQRLQMKNIFYGRHITLREN